jgi:RNA polymerase sigma-70 factor (ECF subfamily)
LDIDFIQVVDDHSWFVYGFFAYRLESRAEAEDLTQATFERALRAWGRFDPARAGPRTWLIAIARNLLIDHYRGDRGRWSLPLGEPGARDDELPAVAGPEERDVGLSPELAAAVATLGDRERELLALRFGGDLTGPEIAAELGLTLANVQQILSRALRKLRAQLEPPPSLVGERADAGQARGGDEHQRQS